MNPFSTVICWTVFILPWWVNDTSASCKMPAVHVCCALLYEFGRPCTNIHLPIYCSPSTFVTSMGGFAYRLFFHHTDCTIVESVGYRVAGRHCIIGGWKSVCMS